MLKKLAVFLVFIMLLSLLHPTTFFISQLHDTGEVNAEEKNIQLEKLDRGLVAIAVDEGVFLSWRLLAEEVSAYSDYGLRGTDFHVYRNDQKIAAVTKSTNYTDKEGNKEDRYYVVPVQDGEELSEKSKEVIAWEQGHYDLPLQKPEAGTTPAGESYTYHANDISVGDVNGDGQYEYVVKWQPSNAKDVSQKGYTGNTYIDTYTFQGELLYRIDLGVNIRSGAHYTQFLVYDFDGNGKSELMFKTAPGTKVIHYENNERVSEEYITMPEEDTEAGYNHDDDYRMNAEDYYEYIVNMFKGWHEHEEVVAENWPKTLEEAFGIENEKAYQYPLSDHDARELADYFFDEYAPSRSERNDLRNFEGFVLTGPEYLTVFNGESGKELDTVDYKPGRHDDGLMWGDYAYSRIEPGNRVDRFLAGVAYLDGKTPSAIFARGYYTRAAVVAYDFNGTSIEEKWTADSGFPTMSNPFNDSPHGMSGRNEEFATLTTQGNHQLSTADVDDDGKQEIVYGGATLDHDGSLLYSSFETLPEGSSNPGEEARLGHGDALHVADINPDRSGLEIYSVFEGSSSAPYGFALRDAANGEVIYGEYTGRDTGRGMIGDIIRGKRGLETWATDLRSADGEVIAASGSGTNMNIKWSADMATQIIQGSGDGVVTIEDVEKGTQLTADNSRTNNGTKGNPSLVADIVGDWREELVLRTTDSNALRIFVSTEETNRKLYTLMQDIQYRTGIAWQNVGYNQPAYPSFYLASDIDWDKVNVPNKSKLAYVEEEAPAIDLSALTSLIEDAKAISNEYQTYTKTSYQALQQAIDQAEQDLDTIVTESELNTSVQKLQEAIDQLEELVELGEGYYFDFGSEGSPLANGYKRVTDQLVYGDELGYGFKEGTDGFRDQEKKNDLLRDFILTNQKEFITDLEDGMYDVRIITGAELDSNTTSFTLEEGEIRGGERSAAGEFLTYEETVEVTDGQLNIYFEGEWARVNGVEIVSTDDYQRKFDFGSDSSPVQYGQIQVANSLIYTEELGYGLDQTVDERDRGEPDHLRRDFVIGEDYQFKVDLRNGIYRLKTITGDNIASNRTSFKVEGTEIKDAVSSGQGEFAEFETYAYVKDGQLNLGIAERINGLEIYYIGPLLDKTDLESMLAEAKQISNDDHSYSGESFIVLKQAIENAELVLESAVKQEEMEAALTALSEAIINLKEPAQVLETKELQALLTEAQLIDNVDQLYTEDSFALLTATIEQAEKALETAIHQTEIDKASASLKDAIDRLEETVPSQIDASVLQELLNSAKGYTNVEEVYTDASFASLTEVITGVEQLLNDAKTQQEIDQAVTLLKEAINQLEVVENETYVINDLNQTDKQDYIYDYPKANDYFNIKSGFIKSMEKDTYLQITNGQASVLLPKQLILSESEVEFFFQEVDANLKEQHKDALSDLISFKLVVDGEEIENFGNTPVIVSLDIDSARVTSEELLRLVYLNNDGKKEEYLKGQYDTDNHQFTSSVEHFSMYGVFEITEQAVNGDTENNQVGTTTDSRNQDTGESSSLPETATNLFNFLLIGIVLIAGGLLMIYLYRRKLQRNK